jgi:hypothetical protein
MKIDQEGWELLADSLKASGWTGKLSDLKAAFVAAADDTSLRQLETTWRHGQKTKDFVFSLIACAKKRKGSVMVYDGSSATTVSLHFPEGSRLEALQMQVNVNGGVYVVRRFDGDWRSCRTFFKKH